MQPKPEYDYLFAGSSSLLEVTKRELILAASAPHTSKMNAFSGLFEVVQANIIHFGILLGTSLTHFDLASCFRSICA